MDPITMAAIMGTQMLMDDQKRKQAQAQAQQQEAIAGINQAIGGAQGGEDPLASLMGIYKNEENKKPIGGF